jgi:hypothetical protein
MSVKDEQLQEIEALNSIYPDEITGLFVFFHFLFIHFLLFDIFKLVQYYRRILILNSNS